ncbi:universal stress protein [Pseudomonas sp. Marseille-QA0892]
MSEQNEILVLPNPSLGRSAALARAACLAERTGNRVHIILFIQEKDLARPTAFSPCSAPTEHIEHLMLWMQETVNALSAKGLTATFDADDCPDNSDALLMKVTQRRPAMVIKDLKHAPSFTRPFMTSLDCQLLRACGAPLHLVGPGDKPRPQQIVAAVDVDDTSERNMRLNASIIQTANSLAQACDATVQLFGAYAVTPGYISGSNALAAWKHRYAAESREMQQAAFYEFAARFDVPVDKCHFLPGHPVSALVDFSRRINADLIAMGVKPQQWLERVIKSSTESMLAKTGCSLLAVHGD